MAAEISKITCAEEDDEESMTPTRRSLFRSSSWSVRSTTTTTPPSSLLNPNKNPHNHRKNNPSIPRPNRPSLTPLKPLLRPLSSWSHLPSTPSSSSSSSSLLNYRDCSRILDHVYLGSESVARDLDSLRRHGITHVLNCVASTVPSFFPHHLTYHTLSLHDSPSEDITSVLYDAFDFIEHVRLRPPSRVLVHCSKGASRSAALVIAYLMWSSSQSFEDSLAHVRSARAVTDPNLGFASQLLQCQSRVHALPPSPGSAVRVYRMAPHSPYDPIHLVPKAVEKPWVGRLDSRGAFLVVNVGSGIWVWVGRFCEEVMAVKASAAAEQVVRYEKAQGEIVVVREGTESYEFWDILSNGDGEDCGEFGKRRVELYDLDFEIFNRAIKLKGRESNTTTMIEEEEENEVEGEEDERERFFSLSSASGDSSTTNSGDTSSTFSPASSSSDWHNCSPSGLEFSGGLLPEMPVKGLDVLSKMPPLRSRKGKDEVKSVLAALPSSSCSSFSMSIAERRGSNPPSLFLLPPVDGGECKLSPREIVQDWCLSPPFVLDGEEQPTSSDRDDDDKDGEEEYEDCRNIEGNNLLGHPILFRWPSLEKLEDINPAALDSGSVFMLLAPDLSSGRRKCKRNNILYVWIGREIKLISSGCGNNSNVKEEFARNKEIDVDRLRADFIHRMALPLDIPVQILREKKKEEELEQFLNHLFPFHQASTAAISE